MPTDLRVTTVCDGLRSDVWDVIANNDGVASFWAEGATIEMMGRLEAGDLSADVPNFSMHQQMTLHLEHPRQVGGGSSRVHIALEPLENELTRVLVIQQFSSQEDYDRLADHCHWAWAGVLDRLRWRMMILGPSLDRYVPFWEGV